MTNKRLKSIAITLGVEPLESRTLLNGHSLASHRHRGHTASELRSNAVAERADAVTPGPAAIGANSRGAETIAAQIGAKRSSRPDFDPADFVSLIDNPYFPLIPGTTFVYEGMDEGEVARDEFVVTHETKQILGVTVTVIRDRAFVDGALVEDTLDWFAQDQDGNVWYFGEDAKTIENGVVVSTEGSWEAGVDGARPGIVMEAHPRRGDNYRQEFAKNVAEDRATVLALNKRVTTPYGTFDHCLKTRDFSRLDPGVAEVKFYAPGVGFIRSEKVQGGNETLELVSITVE